VSVPEPTVSPAGTGTQLPALDSERLRSTLEEAAQIGRWRSPGVQRLALSDADRQMRDTFCAWCQDSGLEVRIDRVGNVFARRPGAGDEAAEPVMVGSHLDTQVAGGRYDGVLGVLAALEVVRWLEDYGVQTARPVEVVSWCNEEGARFRPPMLGSAVFAGGLSLEAALEELDDDGRRFGDELERIGYAGTARVPGPPPHAYFELHIEQDDLLERAGRDLGIVTSAYSARGMAVRLRGRTGHAGSTPMERRQDALVGAAEVIAGLDALGRQGGTRTRATATRLDAWPNRAGIIAGEALITLDYRHADNSGLNRMTQEVERLITDASARRGLEWSAEAVWEFGSGITFDPNLARLARDNAQRMGVEWLEMTSAAGHDAYWLATVAPTLILFVPCVGGVTHNEHEEIEFDRVLRGANVLAATVLEAAGHELKPLEER
jgi:beta-ureidopropionase / N-carbamoyl-L-amino-acid hydrolase